MKIKKDTQTIKWIAGIAGRNLRWTLLLMTIRFLQGYTCILYAYGMGRVIDFATSGNTAEFRRSLLLFIALVLVTLLLQASGRYVSEKSMAVLNRAFRMHAFSQLMRKDYACVTKTHTAQWLNRIVSDTAVVANTTATFLPEITGMLVKLFGALFSLLDLVPGLAAIIFPAGLLIAACTVLIRKYLKGFHKQIQEADGVVRSVMQERLHSLLVIRIFGREDTAVQEASGSMDAYVHARMRRAHLTNLATTALNFAINAAQVLGIGICGLGILRGVITYGTMSSTLYLINLLDSPLSLMSNYVAQFFSMLGSAERLMEIDEIPPDTPANTLSRETLHKCYQTELASFGLRNASFSYEDNQDKRILQDISLDIPKGSFVALTGSSGCGKSTMLKLLMNLYPLSAGSVYWRDLQGRELPLDQNWRQLFAYVPQGNQLLAGTLREMLAFGDRKLMYRDSQIFRSLEIACADAFVRELPDGLDTVLGERGSGLSEGQMQRLAIARAILSERPILFLDEATSALDPQTEQRLLQNLRSMTDKTVLIVTHRESVLEFCDKEIPFRNEICP